MNCKSLQDFSMEVVIKTTLCGSKNEKI